MPRRSSKKIAVSAPVSAPSADVIDTVNALSDGAILMPPDAAPVVTVSDAAPVEMSDGSATVETVIVTVDAPPATVETVVSAPADAAPVNAPVASDAAPVETAPVAPDAPATVPAPVEHVRTRIGVFRSLDPATVDPRLLFRGAPLNGRPIADGTQLTTAPIAPLTSADAPALLALAAVMLASAGSSIAAPDTIPSDAFDPLAIDYLSNRATKTTPVGYFAANNGRGLKTADKPRGPSALDRMMYPVRIAERAILAYSRFVGGTRPAFNGGYGSTDATIARRDSLNAYVSARF